MYVTTRLPLSRRIRYRTILLLLSLFATSASASDKAQLALYVFSGGLPVPGAILVLDGGSVGSSNADGAIHLSLRPGDYQGELQFPAGGKLPLPLEAEPSERLLLIAYRPDSGSDFTLEAESSHKQGLTPTAEAVVLDLDAPKGTIAGQVLSFESGVPIAEARLFVTGVSGGYTTDAEGRFEIEVPRGIYSLSVVHPDFSAQTLREIEVEPGETSEQSLKLTPAGIELDEYVVNTPYLEGSVSALVDEQKNSSSVAEVLGADQMSNAGDSDAAGALKRVTGLTVVDGKYVYVRGLGDRYSSTLLNGAALPSPDPTRRVVPLDIIPTGALQSMVIQKTYSPDLPGDFGGGVIMLRTKGLPVEKVRKLSLSVGVDADSTFQDGTTYEGGGSDVLGIDDGTRQMPSTLDSLTSGGRKLLNGYSDSQVEAAGESLPQNYASQSSTILPNIGLKANLANRNEIYGSDWAWGYNLALNYGNNWSQGDTDKYTYGVSVGDQLIGKDSISTAKTENEIDLSAMLNLGVEIGAGHTLESITMLTRKSTDAVYQDEGYLSENELFVRDTTLEWVERELLYQTFRGDHLFFGLNDLNVDWYVNVARASREEPDTRFYRYEYDFVKNGYLFSKEGQSNERTYESLTDDASSYGLNATLPIYDLFGGYAELKAGLARNQKDRESDFVRFRFLTDWSTNTIPTSVLENQDPGDILNDQYIGPDGYVLRNTTLPTDNYVAQQQLDALYLMGNFEPLRGLKLMAGARSESSYQEVTTYQLTNPSQVNKATLEHSATLPALSATYAFSDSAQLRFAWSKTLNRPDLKELSEAPYIEPESRNYYVGNPYLEVASLTNLDLRYEWYLTQFEMLGVAWFSKSISDPIEKVITPGAGGIRSFANAESAEIAGVEVQARIWLSRLLGRHFSSFFMDTNLSVIDSNVSLGQAGDYQTTDNRPLQGQSPWTFNFTLGYENLIARSKASLMLNIFGERIDSVGTKGLPDSYEQPAPLLDFVYSKEIYEGAEDKLDMKLKVKNLLNPKFETLRGDEVESVTQKGISASLSLSYKWK